MADTFSINKIWTLEDSIKARKLNEEGFTAREIGAQIGRSRNAVIGWFHRQGIPLETTAKSERLAAQAKIRFIKRKRSPPKPVVETVSKLFFNSQTKEPIPQPPENVHVSFMKLTNAMCKSVIGEAKGVDTIYCGEQTMKAGHSWCAYHHKIYFGASKVSKESKDGERQIVSRGDRIFGRFGS